LGTLRQASKATQESFGKLRISIKAGGENCGAGTKTGERYASIVAQLRRIEQARIEQRDEVRRG